MFVLKTIRIFAINLFTLNLLALGSITPVLAQSLNGLSNNASNARIEKAKKVGKMRQKCRLLANQLVPKLSSAQFMQNSQSQNEAHTEKRKQAFLQCLKLSKLATNYTPDLVTLQNALPQYQKANKKKNLPKAKTALSLIVKQNGVKQEGAKIRILNIKPAYQDKMLVTSGLYHIRVEKEGFKRWDRWLKVKGKHFAYVIKLKALSSETGTAKAPTLSKNASTKASTKTQTGFKYPKRQPNPAHENDLAKASALAAQKRVKRAAIIKAKVAAKKEAARLALIQKQQALTSKTKVQTQLDIKSDSVTTQLEDPKFQEQVARNKAKLKRGLRILKAQRKLNAQAK